MLLSGQIGKKYELTIHDELKTMIKQDGVLRAFSQ